MHELSVAENILEISLKYAKNAGANRIDTLTLSIGEFSSIIDDSIQFYWDLLTKDTIAEGSRLVFNRISPEFKCLECDLVYSPSMDQFECPHCKSNSVTIIKGKEFFLESIDIE